MTHTLLTEALRAALTGGGFLLLFVAAELWRRWGNPPVEWTRKLVHFGGGVIAAFFPWIFTTHWTILALGAAFLLILWGTRRLGLLQSVHGVARQSQGGMYFPIAIYLVFLIGAQRPVFYLIAVLVLVVADAAAAVLGSTYGRMKYEVERERRSLEGSAVFFFSTFLIVHLPLLLLTDIAPATSVLVGVQLALIVTLLEAISIEGNDNLIVPLATYFLLHKLTIQTTDMLVLQLVAQVTIIVLLGLVAWRFPFVTASGALALTLFYYGAYSLGGPEWIVGPGIGVLGFSVFYATRAVRPVSVDARYQVVAAFYVCIVPTLLYIANNLFETVLRAPAWLAAGDPFYPLFLGACAAQLALVGWNLEPRSGGGPVGMPGWQQRAGTGDGRRLRPWLTATLTAGAGALLVIGPGAAAGQSYGDTLVYALLVALGGPAVYHAARHLRWWPQPPPWNVRLQAVSVASACLLLLPFYLALRAGR
jgi:dolichol kinase